MPGFGDQRLGERWNRAQRVKNTLIYWWVYWALSITDRLPAWLLFRFGRFAGRVAHRILGGARRNAERALRRVCFEPCPKAVARAAFVQAGENLALTLLLRRPEFRAREWVLVPPKDRQVLEQCLALGRGVVFVSAHVGPFELLAAALAELGFRPAVVVRESYDPRLDPLVDMHRHARGVEVIHRGGPGAAFRIIRVLRQGRPVGFLPDLGGRVPRAPTRFLGWVVDMPVGPTRIAVRTGAPLLVGTLSPVSGRPPGHLPPSEPSRYLLTIRRSEETDEPALRQEVAHELGKRIRAARHHWLWMASGFPWLRDNRTTPYTESVY